MINLFQPSLGTEELKAVSQVFESNWVGKGAVTEQFELNFSEHLGVESKQICSISNCTEGLFQSMVLLGIGEGDEVIVPSIGFVGMANAIAACGAKPVFCDVDYQTLNATAQTIEQKITPNTKAVMILHYGGVPCRMDEICDLVKVNNLALIEDNACSVASKYKGKSCGTFGDISVWSFDAMKILVTGDGGMVYINDTGKVPDLEQAIYLGLLSESGYSNSEKDRWWEFEISGFGRRAIMNDISSAIGVEQLRKLDGFISRRRKIHEIYNKALAEFEWLTIPPIVPDDVESSYYLYPIRVANNLRDRLACYLRENNIYTSFRYYPLHHVKLYKSNITLPNAEKVSNTTLCLPDHQSLTNSDLEKVVSHIREFGKTL